MTINKEEKNLNMPWEQEYGYSQAVKVGDTIYLSVRADQPRRDRRNRRRGRCGCADAANLRQY